MEADGRPLDRLDAGTRDLEIDAALEPDIAWFAGIPPALTENGPGMA